MDSYPQAVQPLLDRIVDGFHEVLSDKLVGIYLHGSLTLGGFNPHKSDIDFLVVVREPLNLEAKEAVAALTLQLASDAPPKGLEFSIVLLRFTQNFVYPTPYEFHYSASWHDRYINQTVDLMAHVVDPDLAAHFVITRRRGHCLVGEAIDSVFGEIPEQHYWASILADAEDILADMTNHPVYSVLNLCRVIAYHQEKRITSKLEGGTWALIHLGTQFHPLIRQALDEYQSDESHRIIWDATALYRFGDYATGVLSENV